MSSWQFYNPDAFVERPNILDTLERWVDDPANEKQVVSLIGPPGSGKTWVLHGLYQRWLPRRLVLILNIPTVINRAEKNLSEKIINEDRISDWLMEAIATASNYYPRTPDFDAKKTPGRIIVLLVSETCQNPNLSYRPVLLVDGYDETEPTQTELLCDRVLMHFLGDECWRLIVARREQRPLHYVLRNHEADRETYELLKRELSNNRMNFSRKQFAKFLGAYFPKTEISDQAFMEWVAKFQEYKWGHPYINAYLFNSALLDGINTLRVLDRKDLEDCLASTLRRGNSDEKTSVLPLSDEDLKVLEKIACTLDETWTEHDLEERLGIKYYEESMKNIHDSGVIVETGTKSRHKIAGGIRQLLREICLHY